MIGIFRFLSQILTIYSFACFIRILLSWIPSLAYTKVTQILAKICDPYLNLFRKIPLQFARLDFTPIIALFVLNGITNICNSIAVLQKFSLGIVIAIIIQMIWSLISSLLLILIILVTVRLILLLFNKDNINFWNQLDSQIYKFTRPITKFFPKNKFINLQTTIIIALITLILLRFVGGYIFAFLINLFQGL